MLLRMFLIRRGNDRLMRDNAEYIEHKKAAIHHLCIDRCNGRLQANDKAQSRTAIIL